MDPAELINKRKGSYLPHWTRDAAIYFITFRTADSLPKQAVEKLKEELRLLDRKEHWQDLTPEELARQSRLKSEAYQKILDNCCGACVLRRGDCASEVASAMQYFAEQRYRLWAWCVMPNHAHAVVQPFEGHALPEIMKAWKSYSSRQINKLLGTKGVFWQPEYYDHLVRDEGEFEHYVRYTLDNPVAAGLREWKWVGRFETK